MKEIINAILYNPLFNLLIFFAWLIPGHSIAIAIIILTVIIRLALLPSSIKAAHYQIKSLRLQPRINKIRSEIKDQQEQSKALMTLYKEEGFSPFGSCLPLLIQIPIIWSLFAVFRGGLKAGNYAGLYSFTPRSDVLNTYFLGLDITKPDPWLLPIIAGILQLALSYLTILPQKSAMKQGGNDAAMMMSKQMLIVAPIITIFFGHTMPAALVIYWITTTVFGIGQQLYVNKQIRLQHPDDELAQIETPKSQIEAKTETPAKKDFLSNMMDKRLKKQAQKTGVNVTVRTKKK